MSSFNCNCPHCGGVLEAQDEWRGMEAECPLCHGAFTIPAADASKSQSSLACQNCGTELRPGMKFCPECGKAVSDTADGSSRNPDTAERTGEPAPKAKTPRKRTKKESGNKAAPAAPPKPPVLAVPPRKSKPPKFSPPPSSSGDKKSTDSKENEELGFWGGCVVLAISGGVLWLLWLFATGYPKTCFWIIAPVALLILIDIGFKRAKAILSVLLMGGIVWWGIWVHSGGSPATEEKTPSPTPTPVEQTPRNRKRSVSVEVKERFNSDIRCYEIPNEYKLYANDECIATKYSKYDPVFFSIKVEEDTDLRAEILIKNRFGAIQNVCEGPSFGESAVTVNGFSTHYTINCL